MDASRQPANRPHQDAAGEGSHWKAIIRFNLLGGCLTLADLRRILPSVAAPALKTMLKELENEGIVSKRRHGKVLSELEYSLTPHGRTLEVTKAMDIS